MAVDAGGRCRRRRRPSCRGSPGGGRATCCGRRPASGPGSLAALAAVCFHVGAAFNALSFRVPVFAVFVQI